MRLDDAESYVYGSPAPPSRPLAELRTDVAELESVIAVLRDHVEWTGNADDSNARGLQQKLDDVVTRLVTSTIAGRSPGEDLAAEGNAILDMPRPGSWYGDDGADGRMLTQEQTDRLIRAELQLLAHGPRLPNAQDLDALTRIVGEPRLIDLSIASDPADDRRAYVVRATHQRGGIDSDPIVRLLAFRAWGDRDRRWFRERGVRAGDPVTMPSPETVARAWDVQQEVGVALEDGRPGRLVRVRVDMSRIQNATIGTWQTSARQGELASLDLMSAITRGIVDMMLRVTDRARVPPAAWRAPQGHGTRFDVTNALLAIPGVLTCRLIENPPGSVPGTVIVEYTGSALEEDVYEVAQRETAAGIIVRVRRRAADEVTIGSHGFQTGDRVQMTPANGGGQDYIVNRIDANRFTLSVDDVRAEARARFRSGRSGNLDTRPPVPPWARERRRRP